MLIFDADICPLTFHSPFNMLSLSSFIFLPGGRRILTLLGSRRWVKVVKLEGK